MYFRKSFTADFLSFLMSSKNAFIVVTCSLLHREHCLFKSIFRITQFQLTFQYSFLLDIFRLQYINESFHNKFLQLGHSWNIIKTFTLINQFYPYFLILVFPSVWTFSLANLLFPCCSEHSFYAVDALILFLLLSLWVENAKWYPTHPIEEVQHKLVSLAFAWSFHSHQLELFHHTPS